MAGKGVDNEF